MEAYAKIKPRHWLGILAVIFLLTHANHVQAARGEVRCQSLDIRNTPLGTSSSGGAMRNELECTIIEGDITLSMMTDEGNTDEMFPVFHNLREITGSILIFQVRGLSSLGRIFPNLRVIGGDSLIMNYALVVYQNQDLRTVGLKKLTVIKNGGVRITENALLCYTRNINWDNMIVGNLRDVILDTESQCTDQCVVENEDQCHRSPTNELACWNATECQTFCPYHKFENGTFGPGCTDTGEMCHEFCLGGCTEANDPGACHTCRNVEINGICAASCPNGLFEHQSRRCLTKEGCESLRPMSGSISSRDNAEWKAFNGRCHYECPSGYEEDPNNNRSCVKCVGHCPKKCRGDETIDSVGAALKFRDCNIIDGYLEIEIRIGNGANAEKFSEAFGELEEVTGYINIRFCSVFTSLHMFKKLRVIHGQQLYRGTYALVVFDNVNLRELFNLKRQQLRIANGKIQFQNNRLLCYKKIIDFANHIGITDLSDNDVGLNSNGDKAVCDEEPLEVEVSAVYSTGFSIRWTPFNTTDMDYRKFMGYQIWYKKVDKIDPEMSIDEDRSVCGDSWNMQFSDAMSSDEPELHDGETPKITANGGELVSGAGIEANSLYAFYVQTRTVNHPGARNAISKIHFVKTTFGNPDPPRIRVSQARGPDRLEIQWDVPLRPEGVITHYTVQWAIPLPNEHQEKINACSDEVQKRPSETVSKKSSSAKLGTCSAQEGCCDCSLVPKSAEEDEDQSRPNEYITEEMELAREERAAFENQIQNKVFVQRCSVYYDPRHCAPRQPPIRDPPQPKPTPASAGKTPHEQQHTHSRRRRHVAHFGRAESQRPTAADLFSLDRKRNTSERMPEYGRGGRRPKRQTAEVYPPITAQFAHDILNYTHVAYNISYLNVSDPEFPEEFRTAGKINVTGTSFLLAGLPHFTEYMISIFACQDVTATDNQCSSRPAWVTIRTSAIPENDLVPADTVRPLNATDGKEDDRRLHWSPPANPNGPVLAYRAKLFRDDVDTTPLFKCVNITEFNDEEGITFHGLADGSYSLEIRTVTLAGIGLPLLINDVFQLNNAFMTTRTMIMLGTGLLILLAILGIVGYYGMNHFLGHKFEEYYWRQTISANPEYLSQIDVYKKDEWELQRDDVQLLDEIGRGTFGQVYRGRGRNVRSACGVVFGECAVKTMPETSTNRERLHFLIEASVMKQFNTSFIVKLFGVVSDQPVLVVMEMMAKGNLRDFLRAHRPDAEENVNQYPLPDPDKYFTWAAQIADGMAYLESIKFCHRDLAARNCMVHQDETVKIGDFGMARDIYYHEYYQPTGKRLMPVRWMSPESLKDGKFTVKSDIWSYGIVLYEMLTLGQQPYAGLGNDQVFNYIGVQRRVMVRPLDCPDHWYNLMRACWRYDPRERPNFYQIVDHLAPNCTPEFRKDSFVVNLTAAERTPEPYNFDVEWADETTNSDGIPFDGEDEELADMSDEPDKVPLDALSIESHQSGEYSDSCSCSTYSDTATTAEHDVHPPRTVGNTHRQILDFLNSARHSQTDMDREKHYDRELLLPAGNSNREDEYVMQDPRPQQVVPPFRPQGLNAQLSIGDADDLLNPIHESQSDPRLRREFSQESEHQGSPHSFKNPSSSTSFSAHNPADWP